MWPRFLCGFANTLVVAYAADGVFSLLDILLDFSVVTGLRSGLATLVVLQSVLALPLLGVSSRLPLSVFGPIVASALWFTFGALPIALHVEFATLQAALVLCQLAIAGCVFLRIRALRGGAGWIFDDDWFAGRLFSWRYLAVYTLGTTAILVVTFVVLSVATLTSGIEVATAGFVRFDSQGVSLADRRYERFGNRIRLVGMMHIGQEEAYHALFRDLGRESTSTLVLTEGVSDSKGALAQGLSYAPLADFLGVQQQGEIEDYVDWEDGRSEGGGPTFMNADLDLSDFDPMTVAWLGEMSSIYEGGDFLSRLARIYRDMQRDPQLAEIVAGDIIERRNRNVIAQIVDHRSEYQEIVVPWGALHLPGVAVAVEEMGFALRSTAYVPLITWRHLAHALLGLGRPGPGAVATSPGSGS